jgi:hypothetical protein
MAKLSSVALFLSIVAFRNLFFVYGGIDSGDIIDRHEHVVLAENEETPSLVLAGHAKMNARRLGQQGSDDMRRDLKGSKGSKGGKGGSKSKGSKGGKGGSKSKGKGKGSDGTNTKGPRGTRNPKMMGRKTNANTMTKTKIEGSLLWTGGWSSKKMMRRK